MRLDIHRQLALIAAAMLAAGCTPAVEQTADLRSKAVTAVDIGLPADIRTISARVLPGATMASLLRAHEVAESEVAALVAHASRVFDLRRVRVDQPYRLAQALDGALRWFEYEINGSQILKIARADSPAAPAFVAEIVPIEKTSKAATVRGAIDSGANSLIAAMDRAGESVDLSLALADIFASDVDFNTELQPGDRYELTVAKL